MIRKIAIYITIIISVLLISSCIGGGNPNSPTGLFRRALSWDAVALQDVEITPEWQEFKLDELFIVGGTDEDRDLTMKLEDPMKWTVNPSEYLRTQTAIYWKTHVPNNVINPQGEQTDIELKLVTSDGREFELYPFTRTSDGIGFEYKYYHGVGEAVPDDTTFTKIRIRSSNAFKCQRLIWTRYTRM